MIALNCSRTDQLYLRKPILSYETWQKSYVYIQIFFRQRSYL